jgi:hypothetical protein
MAPALYTISTAGCCLDIKDWQPNEKRIIVSAAIMPLCKLSIMCDTLIDRVHSVDGDFPFSVADEPLVG